MKRNIDHLTTKQKLHAWADAVEQNQHLEMSYWASRLDITPEELAAKEAPCGTAACALGTAAVHFEGLELVASRFQPNDPYVLLSSSRNEDHPSKDVRAAMEFFGITNKEASRICYSLEYDVEEHPTKQQVVERIREVAEKY